MIYIGKQDVEKIVSDYISDNNIEKVLFLQYNKKKYKDFNIDTRYYDWEEINEPHNIYSTVEYVDKNTLIVIDNLPKTLDRYQREFNVIRSHTMNTHHQLVFQKIPFIEKEEELITLLELADRPMYQGKQYKPEMAKRDIINYELYDMKIDWIEHQIGQKYIDAYDKHIKEMWEDYPFNRPGIAPQEAVIYLAPMKANGIKNFPNKTLMRSVSYLDTYKDREKEKWVKPRQKGTWSDRYIADEVFEFPFWPDEVFRYICETGITEYKVHTCQAKIDVYWKQEYTKYFNQLNEFKERVS